MGVSQVEYKDALRRFASGITIVTAATEGRAHGMTATSFASVSLIPPLVLVCLEKNSRTHDLVLESRSFAVSVLADDQEELARDFALRGDKSFESRVERLGTNGAPLMAGAIAWIECTVAEVVEGGDHHVVIGEVIASESREGRPLLYYDRAYHERGHDFL